MPHADAPAVPAWQGAAHSGVACVQCHIGEGAAAFVHAKLSGVRQLVMVATNSYPKPIPPGAKMPPGAQAETCKSCHQPGRPIGDRIRVIREYADDEANTETMTVLQMHMSVTKSSARAIHWHADPAVRVEYVATDAERQTIPYVRVTDAKGQVKEYRRDGYEGRGDSQRRAPHDGLHRLPQHGRASDLADTGAGRRSGDGRRDGEPRTAVCAARRASVS